MANERSYGRVHKPDKWTEAQWDDFIRKHGGGLAKPWNWGVEEWQQHLEWDITSDERQRAEHPDSFKISFKQRKENRWTRYRAKVLERVGLSDDEISALKYNRLTNLRVAWFLKEIRKEVERIQAKYDLASYAEAASYRRANFVDLLDTHDIEDWDPYYRMGYYQD